MVLSSRLVCCCPCALCCLEQIISQSTRGALEVERSFRTLIHQEGAGKERGVVCDAVAMEGQSNVQEVVRRMVERNLDAICFQLEVDIGRARIMKLEELMKVGTSEEEKMGSLERLKNVLREGLQEAIDKIEMQRGRCEVLQREKEELRAKLVHLEEQAQVQCGVAEAKVGMLLQQVAASQQAEFARKIQAAEQEGQRAALARELQVCWADQARNAAEIERIVAERDDFARETAHLLLVEREVRQNQVEALVVEKERAVGLEVELAIANERSPALREKAAVQERQRRADLKEARTQMEVLVVEKERA
ncbi:unnamed protein product [Closterium sp. Naga37s-1]|nr:unnamed protein product [Closterium sp. Naga37s-1]